MKIAVKVFTESNNIYPYRALFETVLNYEVEGMKRRLNCDGYEDDISRDVTERTGANSRLKTRELKFNNSKVVRLIGRLHSELRHKEKLIPPGIHLDVQVVPARPAFFINTTARNEGDQVQYKYHIVSAQFLIQFMKSRLSRVRSHKDLVIKQNRN